MLTLLAGSAPASLGAPAKCRILRRLKASANQRPICSKANYRDRKTACAGKISRDVWLPRKQMFLLKMHCSLVDPRFLFWSN